MKSKNNAYFCIPIQYIFEYHVENYEFKSGYVKIGDYVVQEKKSWPK